MGTRCQAPPIPFSPPGRPGAPTGWRHPVLSWDGWAVGAPQYLKARMWPVRRNMRLGPAVVGVLSCWVWGYTSRLCGRIYTTHMGRRKAGSSSMDSVETVFSEKLTLLKPREEFLNDIDRPRTGN
ncbi:hypothetical protein Bbelb_207910 [Branchiostoma belcheri]|nr:hypothetical protein Bbelb_207910 [Branchiostoma belcheri]